jgi:ankyrin repeat protein
MQRFDNAPLRVLLENGADPNLATFNGRTPLMDAARAGNVEAMELLLAKNADPLAAAGNGATALLTAAASRNLEAVELLLEHGVDVNAASKRNETAIFNAASRGAEDVVRRLLDEGARVNIQNYQGYTPLMFAAMSESMSAATVKMFLDRGAETDVTAQPLSGPEDTPVSLAGKRGDNDVARLLGVSEAQRQGGGVAPVPAVASERSAEQAIQDAVDLLATQSPRFIKRGGCNSCHSQMLPAAAAALAFERGLAVPETIEQIPVEATERTPERIMNHAFIAGGIQYELFSYAATGRPADEYTDALVHFLKKVQKREGYWASGRGNRPPLNTDDFITTALAVKALKDYGREVDRADTNDRLALARDWLENGEPINTQERAFHLLGLGWAGADRARIEEAATALAATQRADGGFPQLPTMGTDAYATGQALYALHVAGGMGIEDDVYRRGVRYLLRTQADDGSWHVKTRALPVQPYFESGFPYGQDQWISAAGTSWASMALALTVSPRKLSRR